MEQPDLETGTLAVLMERFQLHRLPRAKRMLARVRRGELLSDEDIAFLKRVLRDGLHAQPAVRRHPEYDKLVKKVIDLYTEIITAGIENETRQGTAAGPSGRGEDRAPGEK